MLYSDVEKEGRKRKEERPTIVGVVNRLFMGVIRFILPLLEER